MNNFTGKRGSYEDDGFQVIHTLLDEEQLTTIEQEVEAVTRQERSRFEEGDFFLAQDTDIVQQIEHLQKYSPYFRNLAINHQGIRDLVENIFSDHAVCDNVSYMAKPPRVGAVVPWHQDNAYYFLTPDDALTVWIALDDSTIKNGCLRIVPQSHKHGVIEHGPTGVRGISYGIKKVVDPKSEVAIELNRGDASLHHCNLFHSSHPNTSDRPRRGLVMFFHAERCSIDHETMDQYQQIRKKMIDNQ